MRNVVLLLSLAIATFPQVPGEFTPAGKLLFPRSGHTATLLLDGRVFFAGGDCPDTSSCRSSSEIYNPLTSNSIASGPLKVPRKDHSAILHSDGRVLLIGDGTAELFDAETGRSTLLDWEVPKRTRAKALRLADGHIALACGNDRFADILNPESGATQRIAPLLGRYPACESAALLPDSSILFVSENKALMRLNPNDSSFQSIGSSYIDYWDNLMGRSATTLPIGKVVVAGGVGDGYPTWSAAPLYELLEPDSMTSESKLLSASRAYHADCLSPDGLLLSGGTSGIFPIPMETVLGTPSARSANLIQLDGSISIRSLTMLRPRLRHTCTLLNDGSVLLAGGESSGEMERYVPINHWPELHIAAALPVAAGKALELYVTGPLPDSKIMPHVWVGGRPTTLLYSSPNQINVLVPEALLDSAETSVVFRYMERGSNTVSVRLQ